MGALQSNKFQKMMNGKNKIIKICNMRPSTFEFLRNYFYGKQDLEITAYNVLDLFVISIEYELNVLSEACFEFFSDLNIYSLAIGQLLQFIVCIDSFYSKCNEKIHLITQIFERC